MTNLKMNNLSNLREKAETVYKDKALPDELSRQEDSDKLIQEFRIHQIELELQNEELRDTYLKLEELKDQYYDLFNQAPVGYVILDSTHMVIKTNQTFAHLIQVEMENILHKPFSAFIAPEDRHSFLSRYNAFYNQPQEKRIELELISPEKSPLYVELQGRVAANPQPVKSRKAETHLLISVHDVTARKLAELENEQNRKLIDASLKEKETLLKEIHHRVKNNMNVISSLLKLQADSVEDEQIRQILTESQNRVYSMSAVHESLYRSDNFSEIDLTSYLTNISNTLLQTYSTMPDKVALIIDADDITLDVQKASPLGLVLNELLSNSLKYAFPGDRKGEIRLAIKRLEPGLMKLTFTDNGIGMPHDFNWEGTRSFGLFLVKTLVERQLEGAIALVDGAGTSFTIELSLEDS